MRQRLARSRSGLRPVIRASTDRPLGVAEHTARILSLRHGTEELHLRAPSYKTGRAHRIRIAAAHGGAARHYAHVARSTSATRVRRTRGSALCRRRKRNRISLAEDQRCGARLANNAKADPDQNRPPCTGESRHPFRSCAAADRHRRTRRLADDRCGREYHSRCARGYARAADAETSADRHVERGNERAEDRASVAPRPYHRPTCC